MTSDNGWLSELWLNSPAVESAFADIGKAVRVKAEPESPPPRGRRLLARPAAAAPVQLVRGDRNTLGRIKGPDVSVTWQVSPFCLFMYGFRLTYEAIIPMLTLCVDVFVFDAESVAAPPTRKRPASATSRCGIRHYMRPAASPIQLIHCD